MFIFVHPPDLVWISSGSGAIHISDPVSLSKFLDLNFLLLPPTLTPDFGGFVYTAGRLRRPRHLAACLTLALGRHHGPTRVWGHNAYLPCLGDGAVPWLHYHGLGRDNSAHRVLLSPVRSTPLETDLHLAGLQCTPNRTERNAGLLKVTFVLA